MSEIKLTTGAAPAVPSAGLLTLWAKAADKKLYIKDDAGLESIVALNGSVGPANAVWLDKAGDDGTGVLGDAKYPFATLKAAMAACVNGGILYIGVGTWTIAAAANLPVWTVDKLTIVGSGNDMSGIGGTVIKYTFADASSIFQPPNTADYVEIRDLYAEVTAGTGAALYCNGTGGGGTFLGTLIAGPALEGGLIADNCSLIGITTSVAMLYVGFSTFKNVIFSLFGSGIVQVATSNSRWVHCIGAAVNVEWDTDAVGVPLIGNLMGLDMANCDLNATLRLSKQAHFTGKWCGLDAIRGNGLIKDVGNTDAPKVFLNHCDTASIDFLTDGQTFPDNAVKASVFEAKNCNLNGTVKLKVGAGATRMLVYIQECVLRATTDGIEAGDLLDLFVSGDAIDGGTNSPLVVSGTGTITPSQMYWTAVGFVGGGPTAVSYPCGIKTSQNPQAVFLTPAEYAQGVCAAVGTSTTQITIQTAANTGDIYVLCSWLT